MAGPVELLERASTTTHGVLDGVSNESLHATTPCPDFDVRGLINHMVGGTYMFATIVTGGRLEGEPPDFSNGDFATAYAQAAQQAVAAFDADGALSRSYSFPFGEMPGGFSLHILLGETLVHGWDLARATGQDYAPDAEAVQATYDGAKGNIHDEMRGPGKFFGSEVPVSDDATAFDRLLGYMGRDPSA